MTSLNPKVEMRPPQAGSAETDTDPAVTVWNPALKNSVGFNGEFVGWSGSLEIYNLGHGQRVFDPGMRMFYQMDRLSPFGAGGTNGYQYANNNPVLYVDPTGHVSWSTFGGISLALISLAFSLLTFGAAVAAGAALGVVLAGAGAVLGLAAAALHIGALVVRGSGNDSLADSLDGASFWTGLGSAALSLGGFAALYKVGGSFASMVPRTAAAGRSSAGTGGFASYARNLAEGMQMGAMGKVSTAVYMSRTSGALPLISATAIGMVENSPLAKLLAYATLSSFAVGGVSCGGQYALALQRAGTAHVPPPSPYVQSVEQP